MGVNPDGRHCCIIPGPYREGRLIINWWCIVSRCSEAVYTHSQRHCVGPNTGWCGSLSCLFILVEFIIVWLITGRRNRLLHCALNCTVYCNRPCLFVCLFICVFLCWSALLQPACSVCIASECLFHYWRFELKSALDWGRYSSTTMHSCLNNGRQSDNN